MITRLTDYSMTTSALSIWPITANACWNVRFLERHLDKGEYAPRFLNKVWTIRLQLITINWYAERILERCRRSQRAKSYIMKTIKEVIVPWLSALDAVEWCHLMLLHMSLVRHALKFYRTFNIYSSYQLANVVCTLFMGLDFISTSLFVELFCCAQNGIYNK